MDKDREILDANKNQATEQEYLEKAKSAALKTKDDELRSMDNNIVAKLTEQLKIKEEAARAREADLLSQLDTTKRSARELVASKDREAIVEREKHAAKLGNQAITFQHQLDAKLEAQAAALESEFQGRMEMKVEEFNTLEEEYSRDLAVRDEELVTLGSEKGVLQVTKDQELAQLRRELTTKYEEEHRIGMEKQQQLLEGELQEERQLKVVIFYFDNNNNTDVSLMIHFPGDCRNQVG